MGKDRFFEMAYHLNEISARHDDVDELEAAWAMYLRDEYASLERSRDRYKQESRMFAGIMFGLLLLLFVALIAIRVYA